MKKALVRSARYFEINDDINKTSLDDINNTSSNDDIDKKPLKFIGLNDDSKPTDNNYKNQEQKLYDNILTRMLSTDAYTYIKIICNVLKHLNANPTFVKYSYFVDIKNDTQLFSMLNNINDYSVDINLIDYEHTFINPSIKLHEKDTYNFVVNNLIKYFNENFKTLNEDMGILYNLSKNLTVNNDNNLTITARNLSTLFVECIKLKYSDGSIFNTKSSHYLYILLYFARLNTCLIEYNKISQENTQLQSQYTLMHTYYDEGNVHKKRKYLPDITPTT